ncbi:Asparagine synthetase domain-containing protein 1 [Taenia solium]|eukprot:TsM_000497200 transcript=TsM_000497200 gene=TsM_000497200
MQRIAERNLGRDDRVISDHGREARYPFLDERVVHYLALLPLEFKADLTLRRGDGEKRLLRAVAASLGLRIAARLPKRALQFGSRIAKSESLRKVVGADSNVISAE